MDIHIMQTTFREALLPSFILVRQEKHSTWPKAHKYVVENYMVLWVDIEHS